MAGTVMPPSYEGSRARYASRSRSMPSTGSRPPGAVSAKSQLRSSWTGPATAMERTCSSPSRRRTMIARFAHGHALATTNRYRPGSTGQPSRPSAVIRVVMYEVSRSKPPPWATYERAWSRLTATWPVRLPLARAPSPWPRPRGPWPWPGPSSASVSASPLSSCASPSRWRSGSLMRSPAACLTLPLASSMAPMCTFLSFGSGWDFGVSWPWPAERPARASRRRRPWCLPSARGAPRAAP